jgi:purine-cytosine permease-like protein
VGLIHIPFYHLLIAILLPSSVVPLSIAGAHRFYDALVNFLSLIGYWASAYVAILIIEHVYFRKNDPTNYDRRAWNIPRRLPTGLAALTAGVACFGIVIPCMSQVWFTGPIAKKTGDIGFEVAFAASGVLYFPLRWLEIKWRGGL